MNLDAMIGLSFGIVGGCVLLALVPWWLLLAVGIGIAPTWYKRWRFKWIEPAETKRFIDFSNIGYGTIGDIESMMFIGMSEDKTIRWWYWRSDDGVKDYLVPQAVDDGAVYWNKKLEITNRTLIKHLHGFMDMGNEWPAFYKMTNKQIEHVRQMHKKQEKKQKKGNANMIKHPCSFAPEDIKVVASDLPRADYADVDLDKNNIHAATAAMASDAELLELQKAVKELEEEIHGRCPTLEINVNP